ncbi:MAG: hypothetical protein ABFD44_00810 [Anaerolineaceae bacterium]
MYSVSIEYAEIDQRREELQKIMADNQMDRLLEKHRSMPRFACRICLTLSHALIRWGFDLQKKVLLNSESRSLSMS